VQRGTHARRGDAACDMLAPSYDRENRMKWILVLIAAASLSAGCGVDSMSTAATAAAVKQKELEQGKKTMEQAQQKIGAALEQSQQSAEKAADAADK